MSFLEKQQLRASADFFRFRYQQSAADIAARSICNKQIASVRSVDVQHAFFFWPRLREAVPNYLSVRVSTGGSDQVTAYGIGMQANHATAA